MNGYNSSAGTPMYTCRKLYLPLSQSPKVHIHDTLHVGIQAEGGLMALVSYIESC